MFRHVVVSSSYLSCCADKFNICQAFRYPDLLRPYALALDQLHLSGFSKLPDSDGYLSTRLPDPRSTASWYDATRFHQCVKHTVGQHSTRSVVDMPLFPLVAACCLPHYSQPSANHRSTYSRNQIYSRLSAVGCFVHAVILCRPIKQTP